MNPNEVLTQAQNWIAALTTLAVALAAAILGFATLYAQTRKKLHVVLRGVEESGPEAKAAVHTAEMAANINLDSEIYVATGKPTQRMKRKHLAAILLGSMLLLPGCFSPNLKPTIKEARITLEHLRGDYVNINTQTVISPRLAEARRAEIDAAILNLLRAEEDK